MKLLTCLLFLLGLAAAATGQMLDTENGAIVLLPAELVCAPDASMAVWSPSGATLLAFREERPNLTDLVAKGPAARQAIPMTKTLIAWSAASGRSQDIWTIAADSSEGGLSWIGRSNTAVLPMWESVTASGPPGAEKTRVRLLRVNAESARAETVGTMDPALVRGAAVSTCPLRPFAIVHWATRVSQDGGDTSGETSSSPARYRHTLSRIYATGSLQTIAVFDRATPWVSVEWTEDGSPVLESRQKSADGKSKEVWELLDVRDGSLTVLKDKPALYAPKETAELSVTAAESGLGVGGTSPQIPVLWLQVVGADKARALVAADATNGMVAPDGSAVAYQSRGALWVSRVYRMTRAEVDAARTEALRTVALSNVKQVALTALMYAEDHNEVFPTASEFTDGVSPYAKGLSIFEGFIYLLDGNRLADIASPAETMLGYTAAPGGRAVVYADGHAKWLPDQPAAPSAGSGRP